MPQNYRQTNLSGVSYRRCMRFVAENSFGQTPTVHFLEEDRVVLGDKSIGNQVDSIIVQFVDPQKKFPLINQETGEETGKTMTHAEFHQACASLYLSSAKERDEKALAMELSVKADAAAVEKQRQEMAALKLKQAEEAKAAADKQAADAKADLDKLNSASKQGQQ
ncbi:hypothetical protein [Undibacterium crateris]|uniref:hypothetical protein n=1 Tax=Undibacterium crateris TaxID=2528175 RepID=UPI00138A0EE1|nr:hypothetical protein [Undibacterium crateris]NDI85089.1 hypothetical protein [Undibacterium crateris]